MYQPWQPLGHDLESWPGLEVSIDSRSVKIVLTNWRGGVCFFGLEFSFKHAIAGLHIYDESTNDQEQPGMPQLGEFEIGDRRGYPVWVDRSGGRLSLYNGYEHIDSYFFIGQSIVIVLDVADSEPTVLELSPESINGT